MTCNRVIVMGNPAHHPSTTRLDYIHGTCPVCNGKVTRGARNDSAQ